MPRPCSVIHGPVSAGLAASSAPLETRGRYLAGFQYSFTLAEVLAPTFFASLFAVLVGLPWLVLAGLNGIAAMAMLVLEQRLPAGSLRD